MISYFRLLGFCTFLISFNTFAGSEVRSNISSKSKDYNEIKQIDLSQGGKLMLLQYAEKNNLSDNIFLEYHCQKKNKKLNCKITRIDSIEDNK